ncbi:DUF2461 domain-containing protein [Chryseobacterium taklimakanense]|uniref:DUF2461 domain-containing protein n=1 Tax=Chryseobacterium taklimakanense TaxID=536441 RepID=UPI001EF743F8|nr:DUF2461 domain-containing protein [Chryseobacterium taklimakanense]MCG7280270.1 DUF2461 domain-containing protein [Chryseobacterium taklimakanense]
MIEKSTFSFLRNLKKNNDRGWFSENKEKYTAAQQNVLEFVDQLLAEMSKFDETFAKLDPRKTLFRIYRDTRFSKDKSPYKTNFGASINGIGKKDGGAGYYLHISPGECFTAAGVYRCDPKKLKDLRREISVNADEFKSIIQDKDFRNFEFNNEKLSRVPQGFEKDDPMAEYLKMKNLVVSQNIKDDDLMNTESVKLVAENFRKMSKFVDFLNASFG